MANSVITSKMTQILSLEMAKKAGFLKIGSRDYFSDQINGRMRTGRTYTFVLPDAGNVVEGLVISPRDIVEKKVELTIGNMNNSVRADALELVTDIKWEDEVAKQYAGKLVNAIIRKEVGKAQPQVTTCFVGEGFKPLSQAAAHIESIVNEDVVGFINPNAASTIKTNGQQFQPVGTPSLFGKGSIGQFEGIDWTKERFLAPIEISPALVTALANAKAKAFDPDHLDTLSISGVASAADLVLPKNTPLFVAGAFACDTIGDATNTPYAFVAQEDVALSAAAVDIKVTPVVYEDIGSRSISTSAIAGKKVTIPASGTYDPALVRAEGAYDYTPVNTLEFMLSDKTTVGDTAGIKVFGNAFTDGVSAINTVRWDSPYMAGTVEPRACSLAYIKREE